MNKMVNQELEVMSIICRGIDPRDGTFFETPRDPVLDAARLNYLSALKNAGRVSDARRAALNENIDHPNHGQPWSVEDDRALQEMWALGKNASDVGEVLGRGDGAIFARLVYLEIFESRSVAPKADALRRPPVVRRRRVPQ